MRSLWPLCPLFLVLWMCSNCTPQPTPPTPAPDPPTCEEGSYLDETTDPTGKACKADCNCSNQSHESRCVSEPGEALGSCRSFPRESCEERGKVEPCALASAFQESCTAEQEFLRTCQPKGLKGLVWGDCRCAKKLPRECQPKERRKCYQVPGGELQAGALLPSLQGTCQAGTQGCQDDGSWGACEGSVTPQEEVCDGVDNDCNGTIDDSEQARKSCGLEDPADCLRACRCLGAKTAAEARGCIELGVRFFDGAGGPDPEKARRFYEKACELDLGKGCLALGLMHYNGKGVSKDFKRAKELFEKACGLGEGTACNNLGTLYNNGEGVAQDKAKARELWHKACDLDIDVACDNLGTLYRLGDGVARDFKRAKELFEKACRLEYGKGCSNLALIYRLGQGVAKDPQKARQYYQKACELKQSRQRPAAVASKARPSGARNWA